MILLYMDRQIILAFTDIQKLLKIILKFLENEYCTLIDKIFGKDFLVYYTYTREITDKYKHYWEEQNNKIHYYSYEHCELMIQKHFNKNMYKTFTSLQNAGKKVLIFKLIMMYLNKGVVVDPNIVPNVSLDSLKQLGMITSYIAFSKDKSINLMMMANTSTRRSIVFLVLLLAYIYEHKRGNFYTSDDSKFLYDTLAYGIGTTEFLIEDNHQIIDCIKYKVSVPHSYCSEVYKRYCAEVDLVWFPNDEIVEFEPHNRNQTFYFRIVDSKLIVESREMWNKPFYVDIIFTSLEPETIYPLCEEIDMVTNSKYNIKKGADILVHCDITSRDF